MSRSNPVIFVLVLASGYVFTPANAQVIPNRYTLILEDPPVAERFESSVLKSKEAVTYRAQIEAKQKALRTELVKRHIQVNGSVSTVLNAIFVTASKDRVAELKSLPGVKAVVPSRRYKRDLNRATQLLNAPAAWGVLGGQQNAGAGIRIAILDSGIDQTHPAFQNSSLPMPAGFPICDGADGAYTNNSVGRFCCSIALKPSHPIRRLNIDTRLYYVNQLMRHPARQQHLFPFRF
ncbi:MAG: hypothetical protein ABJF23_34235 [Bryobacteraceae bacterium]